MTRKPAEVKRRAFGYARVSREDPDREKWSISAQSQRIADYCKTYDYQLVKVFEDRNVSGSTLFEKRPGWVSLSEQIETGDIVVVNELTRLGRNLIMTLQKLDELQEQSIDVASLENEFDTSTAVGKLVLQIMLSISEFERARTVERLHQVHAEIHRQGKPLGCRPPYGYDYDKDNKQFTVIEEEEKVVRRVFDMKAGGYGLATIARQMQEEGIPTKRGGRWSANTIKRILTNEIYVGLRTYNGETREYDVPAIVDMETYKTVQATLGIMPYAKCREYMLSGLLRCGRCGGPLYRVQFREKREGDEQGAIVGANWRCRNSITAIKSCQGTAIRESIAEKGVVKLLLDAIDSEEFKKALERREAYIKKHDKAVENLRRQLAVLERRQVRLVEEFTKDDTTLTRAVFNKQNQALLKKSVVLEHEIESAENKIVLAVRPIAIDLAGEWENLSVVARREALRIFIDHLDVLPAEGLVGVDRLKPVWKFEV